MVPAAGGGPDPRRPAPRRARGAGDGQLSRVRGPQVRDSRALGAVAVPINFLLRVTELGYVLGQSDAAMLITMARFRDLDYLEMLDRLGPGVGAGRAGGTLPRAPGGRGLLLPTATGGAGRSTCARSSSAGATRRRAEPERVGQVAPDFNRRRDLHLRAPAGPPKGVVLHERRASCAVPTGRPGRGPSRMDGASCSALPLYHVFSYVQGLLAVLYTGGAIIASVWRASRSRCMSSP